ncbi:MAG: hypothetical protein OXT09_35375 [Myxococcales bacterium]|nr:hypothetical protein [Myxococcales bacterium]
MANENNEMTVIVGGHGKTGRRVAERLRAMHRPVRVVSPSTPVPFDWSDETTWPPALAGASALYLTYHPDLAIPGAAEHVRRLTRVAVDAGTEKIVLLAGRGEPQVHPAEDAVRDSGAAWTILECAFFMQNFSEGVLAPQDDTIAFPAREVREPFIDCDDIADVAVAALVDDAHAGKTYELTGPRAVTFGEATAELARATGRPLRYVPVSFEQYATGLAEHFTAPVVEFFIDLFRFLLDGHNASVTRDVERVLGRPPRDIRDFARTAAEVLR